MPRGGRGVPGSPLLTACASLVVTVLLVELGFRLAGFDFERKRQRIEETPIFYRLPRVPVGEAFFRREGPARWDGPVLATALRQLGLDESLIPEEPAITVEYDALGFRNPADLDDWEVVVVGDSFTELGTLPREDLFTSRAEALLGVPVRNLGVAATGPLTHAFYLGEYGRSASTRVAVLAFFEGNDIEDLRQEARSLAQVRAGKPRPLAPPIEPQSSFTKALVGLVRGRLAKPPRFVPSHFFEGRGGRTPVSFVHAPPTARELGADGRRLLSRALSGWAETARDAGLRPLLLYLPCKRRVLHGRLAANPRVAADAWQPSDLPDLVADVALEHGIGFTDATPALRRETARGRMTYNAIFDTHLNALGSHVVGVVLADLLRQR